MDGYQAFKRIIAPQAFAIWIPILGNLLIGTLKDTSLAFTLGVLELTGQSQTLGLLNRHFIESYLALAIVYFILSVFIEKGFILLEKRFGKYESTSAEKQEKTFKIRNLFGKMNRDVVVVEESTRL
jgi:L-cystine transport system permease protein